MLLKEPFVSPKRLVNRIHKADDCVEPLDHLVELLV